MTRSESSPDLRHFRSDGYTVFFFKKTHDSFKFNFKKCIYIFWINYIHIITKQNIVTDILCNCLTATILWWISVIPYIASTSKTSSHDEQVASIPCKLQARASLRNLTQEVLMHYGRSIKVVLFKFFVHQVRMC